MHPISFNKSINKKYGYREKQNLKKRYILKVSRIVLNPISLNTNILKKS